ncbi:FMN-dependent NADH-azoreductase [Paenibacillus sp. LMG 31456]|uniref:FMN dependent NADH:quinone oxidoreductase n=1 Tax=Paenibacillus foliorum TaxID=2654974 RepID=A0A972K3A3_9BACL|nr:FMN-dependent NADH-azoreductase [Paenibacillus foliorum]NOU96775.1 FMN-dependent NADH-azoreductase [Paenibacillus foliorum]
MSNVLFIQANNRPKEQAVSVKLLHTFIDSYKKSNPEDQITQLDLHAEQLPYLDANMINGLFKSSRGLEMSPEEQKAASTANHYLDQFLSADKIVFGFPVWNITFPAVLHTYLDYLNQAGKTFRYTPSGPVGLIPEKKVALLSARGGVADPNSEMAVSLLTRTMQLFGVEEITTIVIEGHHQFPDKSEQIIEEGLLQASKAAVSF